MTQTAKNKIVMTTPVQIMTTSPKTSTPLTPIAHLNVRSKSIVTTSNQQGGSAPIIRPVQMQKAISEHVVEIIKTNDVIDT